jgi:hypothetical protein
MVTTRGTLAAAWECVAKNLNGDCGVADEHQNVTLGCGAGVIDKIDFASFGSPEGSCQAGYKTGSCDANNSMAVVSKLCLGKSSCTVLASTGNSAFGPDPCFGTRKKLAVQVTCKVPSGPTPPTKVFTYNVTIPVGSTASVRLPGFGANGATSGVTITEGAVAVFSKGKFISGVTGVTGAVWNLATQAVDLVVGSGTYSFGVVVSV